MKSLDYNISQEELLEIARSVRTCKSKYPDDRIRENVWESTIREFGGTIRGEDVLNPENLPKYLKAMLDYNFKMELADNRDFLRASEIPYHKVDKNWGSIRAGFADYCLSNAQENR